jgi:hypothetical protein
MSATHTTDSRRADAVHRVAIAPPSSALRHQRVEIRSILRSPVVQAKLTMSQPGDTHEREADRVADEIMRMPAPELGAGGPIAPGRDAPAPVVQRDVDERADEPDLGDAPEGLEPDGRILPKRHSSGTPVGPLAEPMARGGRPLSAEARAFMEPRFGHDFSSVRVHDDRDAHQLASSYGAAAFAYGGHVFFGGGRYQPGTAAGRRLLAHELTHVVQQRGGDARATGSASSPAVSRSVIHGLSAGGRSRLWRTVEAHVNLHNDRHTHQQVVIYRTGASALTFRTSAGLDRLTSRLIRPQPYPILGKRVPPTARVGRWGLQYFAWITNDGVGFHSNICYPRPRRLRMELTVNGGPASHGCMRLAHGDAQRVYNALSVGDNVYIYDRPTTRGPSWGSGGGRTSTRGGTSTGGGRTYVVQENDTLSEIGDRLGVPWTRIAEANGITDPTSIRPGQALAIPATDEANDD